MGTLRYPAWRGVVFVRACPRPLALCFLLSPSVVSHPASSCLLHSSSPLSCPLFSPPVSSSLSFLFLREALCGLDKVGDWDCQMLLAEQLLQAWVSRFAVPMQCTTLVGIRWAVQQEMLDIFSVVTACWAACATRSSYPLQVRISSWYCPVQRPSSAHRAQGGHRASITAAKSS